MYNIINKLNTEGFYHFKNALNKKSIDYGRKYITDKVNYTKIEKLVFNDILNTVNNLTGLNLKITKYRVSNNNNSSDASGFHRDLQVMNNKIVSHLPIYTILLYLDANSCMQLIPGSHVKYRMNILESLQYLNKSIELKLNPGDILIFHSSMIHKGIFYNGLVNRRLIQCFDCIPIENFNYYNNKILHLPCLNRCNSNLVTIYKSISKIKIFINFFDLIFYFNVSTGYNCKSNFMKSLNYKNIEFLSTESNNPRLVPKIDEFDTINRYIIKTDNIRNQKIKDISKIYNETMVSYLVNILIYIYVIIMIISIIKKYNTKNKN